MFAIIASWVLNICACFSFPFSTSLAYKASSSSRILSSFSDFSRGNSVTSAPLLCCLFAFFFTVFIGLSFSFTKSFQSLGTHLGFFCDLFLRSCCYKILSLILLVSLSEVYSNSTPNFVGSGDAPLAFASSLLCYRNLPSSKSNLSLTTLWFNLSLTAVTLFRFSEICVQILPLSLLPFLKL